MPQPIRMHTSPVMTSAANSVSDFMSTRKAGRTADTPPAIACAQPVMMKLILKPTPVRVTTPITMPTVAAAAPTASAYLAPVSSASTSTPWPMRPVMPASFQPASAIATPAANSAIFTWSLLPPRSANAISISKACSTTSRHQLAGRLPLARVVRPTIAQEVMPVNAAR